ncbi:conserved hypothetical protein [Pirellula staleyi DSM 6068]|uniref:VOC domain-containing protein n=1 Tax=Pirellula staleyi (strain ATCC 27377 / DSM 6068 / ICPB 4128) TaxID=530564 RepID=D2R722_PIRSD|nr:VOC family protein [Pirellula staleyi]ADB19225.1 conserved hypothetical protein [Pirellula staleyi DSM 6068]
MSTKMFLNLPVKDLPKSIEFFTKLGYKFNPQFTDESATCMIVSESNFVMLLAEGRFQEFTPKAIADATKTTEMLIGLSCESRDKVREMVAKALAAGGTKYADEKDYGFMLQHGYQDLDGHIWELFYMDPAHVQPQA